MKFYESNYDEYLNAYFKYNLHPELNNFKKSLPKTLSEFKNMIIYGPSGVGKYTQILSIIQAYSPSKLKYDKKLFISYEKQEKKTIKPSIIPTSMEKTKTDYVKKKSANPIIQIKKQEKKHEYVYRISDIHYEIDMATLGCNSKLVWHELFFQIVDIISVSVSSEKIGIVVCKNFHSIHNELLDIFYSYIRHPLQYNNIQLKFILLTEHIGFIPDNILNICQIIPMKRPSKIQYIEMSKIHNKPFSCFSENIKNEICFDKKDRTFICPKNKTEEIMNEIEINNITNIKEIHSFSLIKNVSEIPIDVFNIICDNILNNILNPKNLKITDLRNNLYDLLIYNIDVSECIWYIFTTIIKQNRLSKTEDITKIINYIFVFLKYYNNNYRSIYHLESITLYIINKIHYG
jgi:hypothetical protein